MGVSMSPHSAISGGKCLHPDGGLVIPDELGAAAADHFRERVGVAVDLHLDTEPGSEAWNIALAEARAVEVGEPPTGTVAQVLRAFGGRVVGATPF